MQCSGCGQWNANGARFCVRCGLALVAVSSPTGDLSTPLPAPPIGGASPTPASSPPVGSAIPFQAPRPLTPTATYNQTNPQGQVPPAGGNPSATGRNRQTVSLWLCRLCGGQVMGNRSTCGNCGAPLSLIANPNDATGTTYLPSRLLYPPSTDAIELGVSSRTLFLPHAIAIRRWHWGAFGLTTPWLFMHGLSGWGLISLSLTLLAGLALASTGFHSGFYPVILVYPGSALLLSLLLGLHGYSLVWETSKSATAEEAIQKERNWQRVGLFCAILKILGLIGLLILAFSPK